MLSKKAKGISYKWLALLTVSIGTYMGTLDYSIVNISFPRLTQVFDTEPSIVLWVTVAYMLVSVGLMLTAGKIGDLVGRKKIYILGLSTFTLGLVFCSLSQTIGTLILSRIVQAIGSSMTVSISNAIVTASFPTNERGKALGIIAGVISAGLFSGPVLGGLLLDALDWTAIFYIRIPVGIIGIIIALKILQEQKEAGEKFKFDFAGAFALFTGLSCFLLFFTLGGRVGFIATVPVVMAVSAAILLTLFILIEKKTANPVVDLNLFKNRVFTAAIVSLFIMYFALSANSVLMPFLLIDALGHFASSAGLILATTAVTSLVVGPLSGWLSDRIGSKILYTAGMSAMSLALFLCSQLNADSTTLDVVLRLVVVGTATGMFVSPNSSAVMGTVPRDKLNTGSAMFATMRQIGLSSGMAVTGTIYNIRLTAHAVHLGNLSQAAQQQLSIIGGFRDTLVIASITCLIGLLASFILESMRTGQPRSETST